ncbi:hypothetical protein BH10ACI4_BH10ACI4_24460 [soil metagenome]
MNRAFTEIFGYEIGDVVHISEWIDGYYPFPEDRAVAHAKWGAYFADPAKSGTAVTPTELRIRCKDGTVKTIISSGVILPETGWALATFVDITDRKKSELLIQLAESQARENQAIYHLLLDHSPDMILLSPFDESRRFVSPAVMQVTGFTAEEYLAIPRMNLLHPEDRERANSVIESLKEGNLSQVIRYRALQKDASHSWVEAVVTGYVDPGSGQTAGYVATVRNIAELKLREELFASEYDQISEEAAMDELTGIANRRTFNRAFDLEAARQSRTASDLAVLLIDVDYFKQFNDLYGHLPGDECLRQIAAMLKQLLRRKADLVARFGGEEFVILVPLTDTAGAEAIARTIMQAVLALNIPHAGSPFEIVTVSVGVACWPVGSPIDQKVLLEHADQALYQAKESGRNQYRIAAWDAPDE